MLISVSSGCAACARGLKPAGDWAAGDWAAGDWAAGDWAAGTWAAGDWAGGAGRAGGGGAGRAGGGGAAGDWAAGDWAQAADITLTARTKVIIAQHTYGYPAAMDAIMEIADRKGLLVVEDCCLAFGSRHKGKIVGTFGMAAYFSF